MEDFYHEAQAIKSIARSLPHYFLFHRWDPVFRCFSALNLIQHKKWKLHRIFKWIEQKAVLKAVTHTALA
jgi:hypothetical protein